MATPTALQTPQYYAERLREYAQIFKLGNFHCPPTIFDQIAGKIQSGQVTREILNDAYKHLVDAVWQEFCEAPWQNDVLNDVDKIIKKGSPNIKDALQILNDTTEPQTTCNQIVFLAASEADRTTRMHLLCYTYLILMEGVYDGVMRFLYAHHLGLGTANTELKDIAIRFTTDAVGLSLLNVWNPTVRNAIGHATYYLDARAETVRFEDRRSHKNVTLSFDELRELVVKTSSIGVALSVLLYLRVLVPLNFGEVSQVFGFSTRDLY